MRFFTLLLLISSTNAIQKNVRRLKPEDIGPLHNDAFDQLTELYRNSDNMPQSKVDLMMDLSQIMEGYCDEDDTSCRNLAYEATMKEFNTKRDPVPAEIEYPHDFHSGMKESIDNMFDTIKLINGNNVDEVVDILNEISDEIKDIEDVNVLHQSFVLSAMSVAVESTKLWHNVFFGEEDHPLRRLQLPDIELPDFELPDFDLTDIEVPSLSEVQNVPNDVFGLNNTIALSVYKVVIADVNSIVQNGSSFLQTVNPASPEAILILLSWPFIVIVYFAIPGSALAAASLDLTFF